MKKNFCLLPVLSLMAGIVLMSCGEVFTPGKSHYIDAADLLPDMIPVSVAAVEVCCTGHGQAEDIIDGNAETFWGTAFSDVETLDTFHAHGSEHYINLDLGQLYRNVTRVEYVPSWTWDTGGV
ncbi:hypothetical protein AGMMS4952_23870 [Spirochaetia bacterium]|nr:hypothetical protein AGMMS4952_23870 [Spirochaetia bacterium]